MDSCFNCSLAGVSPSAQRKVSGAFFGLFFSLSFLPRAEISLSRGSRVPTVMGLRFCPSSRVRPRTERELWSKSIRDVRAIRQSPNSNACREFIFRVQGCGNKARVVVAIKKT